MADKDRFNREMGAYLRSRREQEKEEKTFSINLVRNREEKKEIPDIDPDEIYVDYDDFEEEQSLWDKVLSFFVSGYEEEEENPEELSPAEMEKLAKMQESSVTEEEVEYKDIEDLDEEVPKPNFFEKLIGFFGFGEKLHDYDEIDEFNPDEYASVESERVMFEEDVRDIIKIAHSWIEKLDPETKKEFKESEDFEKYRELLDKLGMLKK